MGTGPLITTEEGVRVSFLLNVLDFVSVCSVNSLEPVVSTRSVVVPQDMRAERLVLLLEGLHLS